MAGDSNVPPNESATQFWEQYFARLSADENATLVDPTHDEREDEARLRVGLAAAGWAEHEIDERIKIQKDAEASAPVTSPGVAPSVERLFARLCDDVEGAMGRLGLDSQTRIARGIEPRAGPLAAMTNIIMTDQAIVTVGSFLFRFCGLVARACTRTIYLNPVRWECEDYADAVGRELLRGRPDLIHYWLRIYLSYAVTGTHILAQLKPATKSEVWMFEEIARAMEIFAVAHEYGHHNGGHGRQMGSDPKREEFEADQFALRVGYELERFPELIPNPYLASGAGGVVLLKALNTLIKVEETVTNTPLPVSDTHPTIAERLERFDTIAVLSPKEFSVLKGFRTVCHRVMDCVEIEVLELLLSIPKDAHNKLKEMCNVLRHSQT